MFDFIRRTLHTFAYILQLLSYKTVPAALTKIGNALFYICLILKKPLTLMIATLFVAKKNCHST